MQYIDIDQEYPETKMDRQEYVPVRDNYSANTGEGCDVANSDKFYHLEGLIFISFY